LVEHLWSAAAVGVIGGPPKACKSWLGLDLAVSVASATPCLDHFAVHTPGPVLAYLAEDPLHAVRDRVAQLCQHRRLPLDQLPLQIITAPTLRLDRDADRLALEQTLTHLQPQLLLLDPLVRLHALDENSSADISALLGFLRQLNRQHQLAIVLVHHLAKRSRADLGQALRGSSDIYAWLDSACYLVRHDEQLLLTVQHRAAAAPKPLRLHLAGGHTQPCHLQLDDDQPAPTPLAEAIRSHLRQTPQPCSRTALRQHLRVNNARLGDTLRQLEQLGLIVRAAEGWTLTNT
jgi:hypothetical protein